MSNTVEVTSLAVRAALDQLDNLLAEKNVDADVRARIKTCAALMYEYIPYAIEQRKDPTDAKVLALFLTGKGLKTATLFGHDGVNCAISIVELLLSIQKATAASSTAVPPLVVLAWGVAMLDLIEVGNSCEFAQQAYYHAFQRQSSVKLVPIRQQANQCVAVTPAQP